MAYVSGLGTGYNVHLGDDPPPTLSTLVKPAQITAPAPAVPVAPTMTQVQSQVAFRQAQLAGQNMMWNVGIGVAAGLLVHLLTRGGR